MQGRYSTAADGQQPRIHFVLVWLSLAMLALLLCGGGAVVTWFFVKTNQASTAQENPMQVALQQSTPPQPTPTPLPMREELTELEAQMEAVYQRVGPGVVNITSRSFDYDFFLRPVPREGTGSGFFYDEAGHIVTNYHVIQNAEELQVTLSDGQTLPATLVGSDPSNDLAVIQVEMANPANVPIASINEAEDLRVGHFVLAIGNPFGLERTLTLGVVSSLGRVIESPNQRYISEVIQTDAPINPGNSGGPLLNLAGEVVGVNSAIFSPSGASAGIGFAIPASTVQRVVPSLIANGRYPHPSLGVEVYELKPETARLLRRAGMDVPVEQGLLVVKSSRRWQIGKGLRSGNSQVRVGNLLVPVGGDIVVAIDGQEITTTRDMIVYLETETMVGDVVDVTVIRDGEEQIVPVELVELASDG